MDPTSEFSLLLLLFSHGKELKRKKKLSCLIHYWSPQSNGFDVCKFNKSNFICYYSNLFVYKSKRFFQFLFTFVFFLFFNPFLYRYYLITLKFDQNVIYSSALVHKFFICETQKKKKDKKHIESNQGKMSVRSLIFLIFTT